MALVLVLCVDVKPLLYVEDPSRKDGTARAARAALRRRRAFLFVRNQTELTWVDPKGPALGFFGLGARAGETVLKGF
jgi:hypothetical protein